MTVRITWEKKEIAVGSLSHCSAWITTAMLQTMCILSTGNQNILFATSHLHTVGESHTDFLLVAQPEFT